MKRFFLTLVITFTLAGMFTAAASALPAEEIISSLPSMWGTDWSRDGKYITFQSDMDIYLYELSSGILRNLTENYDYLCTYPIFSHDSTEIIFSHYHHKYGEMPRVMDRIVSTQAINIETGEMRMIVEGAYVADLSNDGKHLIYTKDWRYRGIFNLETGEEKIFDISDAAEAPFFEIGMSDISPDNSYFITSYLNFLETPTLYEMNKKWVPCKVDISTGDTEILDFGEFSYWYPQFSPDGSKLLLSQIDYLSTDPPVTEDTVWYFEDGTPYNVVEWYQSEEANYWIKDPDSGNYVHPTLENFWNVRNSETAIYRKNTEGDFRYSSLGIPNYSKLDRPRYHVAIYDFAEEEITRIIDSGNFETKMASWSPDGSQVCYIMKDSERKTSSLYICDLELGVHKLVVDGANARITPTSVERKDIPVTFAITGNYPNPFNPTTTIEFSLEKTGDVSLDIFNVMGQKIRTLESARMTPGTHSVVWNGHNDNGIQVSSGVYICRMKMGDTVQSKAMLLAK